MESCKGKFSKLRRDGLKPASTKVPPPLPPWPSNKEKRPASGVSSKTSAITPRQVRCLRDCRDWSSRHLIHVIITHSTLSIYVSLSLTHTLTTNRFTRSWKLRSERSVRESVRWKIRNRLLLRDPHQPIIQTRRRKHPISLDLLILSTRQRNRLWKVWSFSWKNKPTRRNV